MGKKRRSNKQKPVSFKEAFKDAGRYFGWIIAIAVLVVFSLLTLGGGEVGVGLTGIFVGGGLVLLMSLLSYSSRKDNSALMEEERNIKKAIEEKTGICNRLDADIQTLEKRKADIEKSVNAMEANERKALTLQKNIARMKTTYDSMTYTLNEFSQSAAFSMAALGTIDLSSVAPIDLHCLTLKELRARYRAVDKDIRNVYESHRPRFSEASDPVIYNLMILVLESERRNLLLTLAHGKLADALDAVALLISKLLTVTSGKTAAGNTAVKRFLGRIDYLYTECIKCEYEYYVQKERAKEEQRALREQMRQEAAERRKLEEQRKKIEMEEQKYRNEIERITAQLATLTDENEIAQNKARLAELGNQMGEIEGRKEEIIKLQNGKAGTVYVISNLGSFGENVFKIGMTRRLEPQDRIDELASASVPFPFDVHSFIFSDDAVSLETELHKELNARRINKVNLRKEFFNVPVDDLQALVEKIDPAASFTVTAAAEQYRQSLSITDVPEFDAVKNETVDDEEDVEIDA